MKKINFLLLLSLAALFTAGCSDKDSEPVPIAPILKDVVMPSESNAMPGSTATISGKGFDTGDKIHCTSLSNEANFDAEVTAVTDYGITIKIPSNAAGLYEVAVERAGLVSMLPVNLKVAYVIVITDLTMPAGNFATGSTLSIAGKGFAAGDKAVFSSEAYPSGVTVTTTVAVTSNGISIVVPASCYGVNTLTITRGQRQGKLGTVNVKANIGDAIGGGIVYYVSDGGIHGLIAKKTNTGTAVEQWGPTSLTGGTSKDLYKGKANTRLCVAKMVDFHNQFATWPLTKKSAAEQCVAESETVAGVTYNDWFLPSQQELVELFKAKDMLSQKGAAVAANNYWSSSEGDSDANAPIWSAYYVNFYEPVNLVTANADKEGWKIGIRAIRQF